MKISRAEPTTAEAFYLLDEDEDIKGKLLRMSGSSGASAWLSANLDGLFPIEDSLSAELEVAYANVIKEERFCE